LRKIFAFERLSADGSFADAEGGLGWVVPDQELDRSAAEKTQGFDTLILGRKTYQMFAAFWPHVGRQGANPHDGGKPSAEMLAMATLLNQATKVVLSRTLGEAAWGPARLLRELDAEAIAALKRQPGKDILVLGSGSLVTQLLAHGLLDELQLVICPKLIGGGKPLLAGLGKDVPLELLEAKAFATGNLSLRYAARG
jgi:dihydrofolate reductase